MKIKKLFFVIFVIALLIPSTSIFANYAYNVEESQNHYRNPRKDNTYDDHMRAIKFIDSYDTEGNNTEKDGIGALTNRIGNKHKSEKKDNMITSFFIPNINKYLIIHTFYNSSNYTITYDTAYLSNNLPAQGMPGVYYFNSGFQITPTPEQLEILQGVYQ